MASLLPGMTPETLTLAEAVSLLRLPREVGRAVPKDAAGVPQAGEGEKPIVAANGRFGPYLKWGTDTRSIPAGESPTTVTLERALELFAQPKTGRGGKGRSAAKALKELGAHPKSGAVVKVLDGRYGAYITDGTTNATVPKGDAVESLTLERALELLEARAALGPPKKRPRGRSRG
jgi:DNA topoisomerase-1